MGWMANTLYYDYIYHILLNDLFPCLFRVCKYLAVAKTTVVIQPCEDPCQLAMSSSFLCYDMGTILQFSKETLPGKWNLSCAFMMPAVSMPSITLQSLDLTTSRTVSVADSQPKTITASYCFAHFCSFLRFPEVHMHINHW